MIFYLDVLYFKFFNTIYVFIIQTSSYQYSVITLITFLFAKDWKYGISLANSLDKIFKHFATPFFDQVIFK